jgi:N-acetylglucosaminyldiphosphoundecaprenol N-acetyl-beta-D-mannosaminyltransferase
MSQETLAAANRRASHPFEVVNILETPCVMADFPGLVKVLHEHVSDSQRPALSVDFTNVHIVTMRRSEPDFNRTTENVDLFVPDSTVLHFCTRMMGGVGGARIYGPWFMGEFLKVSPAPFTHYFLGGTEDLRARLVREAHLLQPHLVLLGSHHGYLDELGADDAHVVREINALAPDFIWVGMGTPRQQAWINRNKQAIKRGVLLAVGFAFDVNAKTKSDAPAWMQSCGLTWLYRLLQEPRRLGLRYLHYNGLFLRYFVPQWLNKLARRFL